MVIYWCIVLPSHQEIFYLLEKLQLNHHPALPWKKIEPFLPVHQARLVQRCFHPEQWVRLCLTFFICILYVVADLPTLTVLS
jgi:hypothetical protein